MFIERTDKNPNPTKDQHFMVDKNMLRLIYDTAGIEEGESIVEIGGGSGALTDYLIEGNNYVTVIEKDPYYAALLKAKYASYSNVTVVEGDALDYKFNEYDRIVANLPYTITEPFLINLASSGALDYKPSDQRGTRIKSITLVLSQNSTRKMVAPVQITEGQSRHANQEFGIMSAICKSFCDVDIVTAIPSEAFYPEPAVTSFVVNLTPKKTKTTVDRIVRELLMDKKGTRPTIKRIYQLMIAQGKIYKTSKHKNNASTTPTLSGFTSKLIENSNIYDLSNTQISQLIGNLIRNDISMKTKSSSLSRKRNSNNYFCGKAIHSIGYDDLSSFDEEDDDYEEELPDKSKFMRTYDYMFDSREYNVLLRRGLENIEPEELQYLLGQEKAQKGKTLVIRR